MPPLGQDLIVLIAPSGGIIMVKTCLFCRVSSTEQAVEGYSLPAQKKLLEDYAQSKDFKIDKVFELSESASGHKQRKIFNEMLGYLEKNNVAVLVVEKTDRLTRNIKDAVAVNEWVEKLADRQVHFVKENFILHRESKSNEKFIWNVKVSVAQYYIDNLSEEVKKGQKEKLAQGYLPTKPPLGYKTIGEKGHRIHIIDEISKHYAVNMFSLYDSGNYSLSTLALRLYKDGLRSDSGKKVPKSRIHSYLHDPFYIGLNKWNGAVSVGKQDTFIDQYLFNRVQARLEGKNTPKISKHSFLFKGLITCKECGGTITWEIQKGTVYGHCNHYRNCSTRRWAKEGHVEDQVATCLAKFIIKNERLQEWIRKALKESHKTEQYEYVAILETLNAREKALSKRISNLYDDKVDGKITPEFYNQKYNEYDSERKLVLSQIDKTHKVDEKHYEAGATIYDISQKPVETYYKRPPENKRTLFHYMFKEMHLNEMELTYTYTDLFEKLLKAVEESNSSKVTGNPELLNKIFELGDFSDIKRNIGDLGADCSTWLPRLDSNQQPTA